MVKNTSTLAFAHVFVGALLCLIDPVHSAQCALPWNDPNGTGRINKSIQCPYGTRLPGDVTLPKQPTLPDYICVVYGYIPYAIVLFGCVEALAKGPFVCLSVGTREVSFLAFCICIVAMNELVLKNIVKQQRPDRSCNYSCGFPSGHSTMAAGFFVLMFLDGVFRILPKTPLTIEEAMYEASQHAPSRGRSFNPDARAGCGRLITLVPLSALDVMSHFEFTVFTLLWGVLLLPVPLTRIALNDHTPTQVIAGSTIGAFEALAWFVLTRRAQRKWNKYIGKRVCTGLMHNYALPRFQVKSNCVRLLAQLEQSEINHFTRDLVQRTELVTMRDEIEWYLTYTVERHQHILAAQNRAVGLAQHIRHDYQQEMNFLDFESHDLRRLQRLVREKLEEGHERQSEHGTQLTPASSEVIVVT